MTNFDEITKNAAWPGVRVDLLVKRLRRYNEWRRGAEIDQPEPSQIGADIDEAATMLEAMSDLLTIDPDVDLLNMDNDSIWTVMELFMANEAFNRLNLDIGQLFESERYSPREAVSRMNDMRDYLKSEISAQIQELRKDTSNPTKVEMNSLLQSAIKITFEVFEESC